MGALPRTQRSATARRLVQSLTAGISLCSESGMTLVETAVAAAVVLLLAMALGGAAEVVLSTQRARDEAVLVRDLGTALLDEVASLPFDDPDSTGAGLGPEAGEWSPPADRSLFDDVDDYTVWTGQSLQDKDGTPLNITDYTRAVSVEAFEIEDKGKALELPTQFKRITVTVLKSGQIAGTFVTLRAQGGRYADVDG